VSEKFDTKLFFFIDTLYLVTVLGSFVLSPLVVVALSSIFMPFYLILTKRARLIPHIAAAFIMAGLWVSIAHGKYYYTVIAMPFGLTVFPFFAWSIGLMGICVFSEYIPGSARTNYILTSTLYVFMLLFFEMIAYHVLNIKNAGTSGYPGLPGLDCIHVPRWMQVCYISMGPIYLLICYGLNRVASRNIKSAFVSTLKSFYTFISSCFSDTNSSAQDEAFRQ
jgi:hypothetical protein